MQKCRLRSLTGIQNLMVTVKRPCSKPISQMVINNGIPWQKNLLKAIKHAYSSAPYFEDFFPALFYHVTAPNILVETLDIQTTLWIANTMGKQIPIVFTQNYFKGVKNQLSPVVEQKLQGTIFQEKFHHPKYPQTIEPFEPGLSVLDALFCIGPDELKQLLIRH